MSKSTLHRLRKVESFVLEAIRDPRLGADIGELVGAAKEQVGAAESEVKAAIWELIAYDVIQMTGAQGLKLKSLSKVAAA